MAMTDKLNINRRHLIASAGIAMTAALAQKAHSETSQPDLSGKSILITGTSSGFGSLSAE